MVVFQGNKNKKIYLIKYYFLYRMRLGRSGGSWRHIQQTNSHSGSNLLYINGICRQLIFFIYIIFLMFRYSTS